jgi:hypothetical protein
MKEKGEDCRRKKVNEEGRRGIKEIERNERGRRGMKEEGK